MGRRRSHRGAVIGVLVPVLLALAVPVRASAGAGFLVGVTYGNQGWAMDQVRALEA